MPQQAQNRTENGGRKGAPPIYLLTERQKARRALAWRLWMETLPTPPQAMALFGSGSLYQARLTSKRYLGLVAGGGVSTRDRQEAGLFAWPVAEQLGDRLARLKGCLARSIARRARLERREAELRAQIRELEQEGQ